MADPNDKVQGQTAGRYYVDSQCIDCDLCRETAPANFQRNDEAGFSYVYKQPETEEEETLCKDALDNCPGDALAYASVRRPPGVDRAHALRPPRGADAHDQDRAKNPPVGAHSMRPP